jgi:hypothetical protein
MQDSICNMQEISNFKLIAIDQGSISNIQVKEFEIIFLFEIIIVEVVWGLGRNLVF